MLRGLFDYSFGSGYNAFEHKCDIFNVGVVKSAKFGNI